MHSHSPLDGAHAPPTDQPLGSDAEVVLLNWPADAARCAQLAVAGVARLLLVEEGHPPPSSADLLEDWVRVPADPHELASRRATLASRARRRQAPPVSVVLDADGIVHLGERWLALSALEARLLAALLVEPGAVTKRDDLVAATWPDGPPSDPRALDVRIKVLRKRLAELGLRIHTVARRGYLVELPAQP